MGNTLLKSARSFEGCKARWRTDSLRIRAGTSRATRVSSRASRFHLWHLAITLLGALPGLANSYRSFRESDLFPYIQDTWKVSRTVTLNLGLRYDFISNPVEAHNLLCAFIDPSSPSTTGCTPVLTCVRSNPSVKSLDPRVGIAWDPFHGSQDFNSRGRRRFPRSDSGS